MSDYVISTRIDRIKLQQSTLQIKHDIRTRIPKEYDLRRSASHQNKMMDSSIVFSALTANDEQMMKKHRNQMIDSIKDDYQQSKGKSIPSNTTFTISGVVTFGVSDAKKKQRPTHLKDLDELTDYEADDINSFDLDKKDEAVKEYMQKLEETYGTKVLYCVRHSDEKVDHYHFQMLNYDFVNHKTMLSNLSKYDMMKMGENLQDMCGESFQKHSDGYFGRGAKREKKAKHKDIKKMHDAELKESKIKIQREREIKQNLDRENQAIARKHEMMKNDLDDYENRKRYYQKELQNLKSEYESFKNSDKIKQIDAYKTLKFTVQKLENELNTKTEKVKKMDEIIGQKKGEYDSVKDLVAFLPKAYDEVEEEGFFLKKQIHAPAGYTFIKTDDYQKVRNAMIGIKKYEKENNCSINDVMQENIKLKREKDLMEKKHQNEINTIQFNAQKMINNITKQAKETYDEKVYELQCIINEQADNLKHFRNKVSDMMHTLKVKFGITEKDLNTDGIKFSKTQNDSKEFGR